MNERENQGRTVLNFLEVKAKHSLGLGADALQNRGIQCCMLPVATFQVCAEQWLKMSLVTYVGTCFQCSIDLHGFMSV